MFPALVMSAALALGQHGQLPPDQPAPNVVPAGLPAGKVLETAELLPSQATTPAHAARTPEPLFFQVPIGEPPKSIIAEEPEEAAGIPPDRYLLMKSLQGTWLGALLDDHRTLFTGWIDMSYTGSSAATSNLPVTWNDRANKYLLQQLWFRLERPVVLTGTTEPTVGYRLDVLYGTDYRFTLPRGLWNSQLLNADGQQNLYGVDPVQFYVNAYCPTLFNGTEFRVGRLFCPFGVESIEAVSTPLLSRSYAFNWAPPFTHVGGMVVANLHPQWVAHAMLVNGNDVFIDKSQEMRFIGRLQYTSKSKRDFLAFGTSVGRGKFNAGDPFNPTTISLMTEGLGRNNINVFDLVYTRILNPRLTYSGEIIYGYQTNVPGIFNADGYGTPHWLSVCQYLTRTLSQQASVTGRLEFFDDFSGQRTGFEGLYTAATVGFQFRPWTCVTGKDIILRPELRYDYNNESRPFEGKHWLVTAAADVILRW